MNEKNSVKLIKNDKELIDLPILKASLGKDVIDIRNFNSTNMFTFDPGFLSTASCKSQITYVDGEKGQLYYRGYPIEQLAEKSDYLETCYLLLNGELPSKKEFKYFKEQITKHTMVHEQLTWFFRGFRRDAHPMAMMVGVVGALAAFYQESLNLQHNKERRKITENRLISKIPTIAAMCYKYSIGAPFIFPKNNLSYTANFMHMMFSNPCEEYIPNPTLVKALDIIFILHADHEQNASTSTVRLAGSSGANPFACMAAGIACLWGPAHGGANEAVLKMLDEIGDVSKVAKFMQGVKEKKYRLMGFGHRVYKNMDPRATIMKKTCHDVLNELGLHNDSKFKLALALEKIALEDNYFIERKLYPNVDFYSGIVLSALGIPVSMFTVIFALARTVGWIAHWDEMISDNEQKIGRPRQLYTGSKKRDYISIEKR